MSPDPEVSDPVRTDGSHDLEGQIVDHEGSSPSTNTRPPTVSKKISMLAVSDDPFAPREGKTLTWKNVNMTLVSCLFAMRD
jgi:hypothetical protein